MSALDSLLRQRWSDAQEALTVFLDDVHATNDAHTTTLRLLARKIQSPQRFADQLNAQVKDDGTWAFLTTTPSSSGIRYAYAMPVSRWRPEDAFSFPFVEIHTVLVAWWLTTAWRTRQLAQAAFNLADSDDFIAAAACVRPLVESAAAHWVDGRKIVVAWDTIKTAGHPATDQDALNRRTELMKILNEVTFGAKFSDRVPELKNLWSRVQRSNVLGQVEKLAKASTTDLQSSYEWLCNTVHPSIGNTFAFSAPPFLHFTKTHAITWFAGRPIHADDGRHTFAERSVQTAVGEGAVQALEILRVCMDASLRSIDDLALTTRAPTIVREGYWRNIKPVERNERCPCRSGLKSKRCPHEWGGHAPDFPTAFELQPFPQRDLWAE